MVIANALFGACSNENGISAKIEAPPQVAIQGPSDGHLADTDDVVEFVGVVADGNGLDDITELTWVSDRDGALADLSVAPLDADGVSRFGTTLSEGTHTVTLTAVDSSDRRAQQSVSVVVTAIDTAPYAEISSPAPFSDFQLGSPITLIGGVADPNQPPEQLVAQWTFEPESGGVPTPIPTGAPSPTGSVLVTWADAPKGTHRVWLTVTDREGHTAAAEIVLDVFDPNEGDADGDVWTIAQGDCDDTLASVHPGADEACNGEDDDCNQVDDDKDLDSDGHVDEDCVLYRGALPVDDCDDSDGSTFLGASEQLDGADNDCNGVIDDGLSSYDADGDCACTAANCTGSSNPACATVEPGDCDDDDPALNPFDDDGDGASSCDGDCDDSDPTRDVADRDGDGATTCAGDCDDTDPGLTPLAWSQALDC